MLAAQFLELRQESVGQVGRPGRVRWHRGSGRAEQLVKLTALQSDVAGRVLLVSSEEDEARVGQAVSLGPPVRLDVDKSLGSHLQADRPRVAGGQGKELLS